MCMALDLVDCAEKREQYRRLHQKIWPEVRDYLRRHGVVDMEIYQLGNRLFMVMEVSDAFDQDAFAKEAQTHPTLQRWEAQMWQYQQPTPWTPVGEKWVAMERIFSLQQQ